MNKEKETLKENRINAVIDTALGELGYTEEKNNKTKYALDFDTIYKGFFNYSKQYVEWCSVFVSWLFCKNFGPESAHKMLYQPNKSEGASCRIAYNYYLKNKAITNKPSKGLQIFFKDKNNNIIHTGIIYKVDSSKIYTIEGNKSNMVKKCSYNLNSTKIYPSFGIPDYTFDIKEKESPKEESASKKVYKVIAKSGLNVRKEPSKASSIVKVLRYETVVTGEEVNKEWIKINDGYIFKKYTEVKK